MGVNAQLNLPIGVGRFIPSTRLQGLCSYFSTFPLSFPLGILHAKARDGEAVLDPFCGRGTTNFAARLLGLPTVGIDASPVAVAITAAKMVRPDIEALLAEAKRILSETPPGRLPEGEFWQWAYHPEVLADVCRLRSALLTDCTTEPRIALRGLVLAVLHGDQSRVPPNCLSNRFPRIYSPTPGSAVRFWQKHQMYPPKVDVLDVIARKAEHFYGQPLPTAPWVVRLADSSEPDSFRFNNADIPPFRWVITSPPYYGVKTYISHHWVKNWFMGGPDDVPKVNSTPQIDHSSVDAHIRSLRKVWVNTWHVCADGAVLVIRYGSKPSRNVDPIDIIRRTLDDSGWRVTDVVSAGTASLGKRQTFLLHPNPPEPKPEYDIWATRIN